MAEGVKNRALAKELTTSNQDIYTVPGHFVSKVTSIIVSNKASTTETFTLDWGQYDKISDTSTYYTIGSSVEMKKNSILQIDDVMYLRSGDSIRALASNNSAITVTVSVEESFRLSEL